MRELLIDPKTMGIEKALDNEYAILVGEMVVPGGFACESYGVRVASKLDSDREEIPDITVSISRIDELMELLVRNEVTPVTLRDVVEDWL